MRLKLPRRCFGAKAQVRTVALVERTAHRRSYRGAAFDLSLSDQS